MNPTVALRPAALRELEALGPLDLLVGIPTFNCEASIPHVVATVSEGLRRYFPGMRAAVLVSDGGSLDETRERAAQAPGAEGVRRLVSIYRGPAGKGTALRAVFEAAVCSGARAAAVFDADLESITPDWVRSLIEPILQDSSDFVSPFYIRHKYDGTITNNIAYSLTRALYGKRVRQPIGGDFGFSRAMAEFFSQDRLWDTDVTRFGVDIWMTTVALNEGFRICEAILGAKIHAAKDPAASLAPMFRQVVGTLFGMMPRYEARWRMIRGSERVPLVGQSNGSVPPAIEVNRERLVNAFRAGYERYGLLWREILEIENYRNLELVAWQMPGSFRMPTRLWVRTVYDFAAAFLARAGEAGTLLEALTPVYFGRVASFIEETAEMDTDQADRDVVEAQALLFEEDKPYLLDRVDAFRGGRV